MILVTYKPAGMAPTPSYATPEGDLVLYGGKVIVYEDEPFWKAMKAGRASSLEPLDA